MSETTPNNLNKVSLDIKGTIPREPNLKLNSHFAIVTPVFRDIEDFLVSKIRKYPAVVGSVYTIGNEKIAYALAERERVFLLAQNANFRPGYLSKSKWEKELGWNCYPFQTSVKSILDGTKDRWFVEAGSSIVSQGLEELLEVFEQEEFRKLRKIEINSEIRKKLQTSLNEEQITKIVEYCNILSLLSPIDNLFCKSNSGFLDFTEIAKLKPSMNPYWVPGKKVLMYSNEGSKSDTSSKLKKPLPLMHHKFIVFLEKVEKLFNPTTNPNKCWKCGVRIEQPDLPFWDEIYEELLISEKTLEEAESVSQEWEIPCSNWRCDEYNTFYNPNYISKYEDLFPSYNPRYKPVAVWTGSFNFTYSAANKHLENGVFIDDSTVADIYFQEWAMNCIISEKFRL